MSRNLTRWKLIGIFIFVSLLSQAIASTDPEYCKLENFKKHEISLGSPESLKEMGLKNIHAFQLGQVMLIGLALGDSRAQTLIQLAKARAPRVGDKRYCTWYLNHPNKNEPYDQTTRIEAAKFFNHRDIMRSPSLLQDDEAILEIWKAVEKDFDSQPISFLSCALENHFIALGCNGMAHRGPTVFGMLLAFSGCLPKQAFAIANHYWNPEGLREEIRLGAIEKTYKFGLKHAGSRKRMVSALLE